MNHRAFAITTLAGATLAGTAALTGCVDRAGTPGQPAPVQASEVRTGGEKPPDTAAAAIPKSLPPATIVNGATQLRFTELSRASLPTPGQPRTIDLRIEALDAEGAPARIAGEVRIVLRCEGCDPEYSVFDLAVLTADAEKRLYNETLRLYCFRVEPKFTRAPEPGKSIEVSVALRAPDDRRAETTGSVTW